MTNITHGKHVIDAAGQRPGRLATQIVKILTGKDKVTFERHIDMGGKVAVKNADKCSFSGKKMEDKIYRHHSMHPGGLKEIPVNKVMEDPTAIIRTAVSRMLPRNKHHTNRLNRLTFVK